MATERSNNRTDNSHWDCSWFQKRLNGPDGHHWQRARKLYFLSRYYDKKDVSESITSENKSIEKVISDDESLEEIIVSNNESGSQITEDSSSVSTGIEDNFTEESISYREDEPARRKYVDLSTQKLFDLLVTCWKPKMMEKNKWSHKDLQYILKINLRQPITQIGSTLTKSSSDSQIQTALDDFCSELTKLHYLEIWNAIVEDYRKLEQSKEDRSSCMDLEDIQWMKKGNNRKKTAMLVGTTSMLYG
jgi:hypothetical protein